MDVEQIANIAAQAVIKKLGGLYLKDNCDGSVTVEDSSGKRWKITAKQVKK